MDKRTKKDLGARASNPLAAMDALARLLATRERSTSEAQKRLIEKGYTETAVEDTLKRAVSCGLLDDQRFAQDFIKTKLTAGWGARRIEQELYRFGISKDSIEGYPDAFYSNDDQLEKALVALKKHRSKSKNPRQAAYRYLAGRGFSHDVIHTALRAQDEFS